MKLGAATAASALLPSFVRAAGKTPAIRGLRGIMIDAARLPERPAYYRRIIDFCREWDLNTILCRLTDDQGSALLFESHPEFVTHAHALTPTEARDLAEYARSRGVDLIPEVESFGHTSYITSVAKYQHLGDTPPNERAGWSVGLSPVHPDSLPLMRDLYREVATIFPSRYLHGGCDEVNWGGSELSRQALARKSRAQIWSDYVNGLEAIAHELDKEFIIWGDVAAHREPEILTRLNRRTIIMDWQYYVTDPAPLAATAQQITGAGLRVIGAPALISCEWGPRPGAPSLANVEAFAAAYAQEQSKNVGVIVTNWIPSRWVANSLWDCFAHAAVALNDGPAAAHDFAFRRFVERYYGGRWNDAWEKAFADLYRITPGRTCTRAWNPPRLPLPSASDEDVKKALTTAAIDFKPYEQIAGSVHGLQTGVTRNAADFACFSLAVDYLAHTAWREQGLRQLAATTMREIARRDAAILQRLEDDWNLARFADSPTAHEPVTKLTAYDQLLFRMRQAAQYSAGKAG